MKKLSLIICCLLMFFIFQRDALAFSCRVNGAQVSMGSNVNIPVNITLDKTKDEIILFDLASYFICDGAVGLGHQDAIRITPGSASLHPSLVDQGYTGFIIDPIGAKYDFSVLSNNCIWPDSYCTVYRSDTNVSVPVKVKVGIKRSTVPNGNGVSINAGTTLASFRVQQRGAYRWGIGWGENYYTFNFNLKSPFVMPAYTCNVSNPNLTVDLKPVSAQQLRDAGAGRYTEEKPFSFALTCEPETAVDIKFEGTTMAGYSDVLKNTNSQTEAVGIQILHKNTPVVYGQTIRTINSASSNESLDFKAHYFYNGGQLNNGSVRSLATVTFDYK